MRARLGWSNTLRMSVFTGFRLLRMDALVSTSPPHPNPLPHKLLRSKVFRYGQASGATTCGERGLLSDRLVYNNQGCALGFRILAFQAIGWLTQPNRATQKQDKNATRVFGSPP